MFFDFLSFAETVEINVQVISDARAG